MGLGVVITVNGVPDPDLAGASSVEVYERMGQATTYCIHYGVDISEGDLPLLAEDKLSAGSELSILGEAGGEAFCLVKGPVYGQRIHLVDGCAGSDLEVLGADTSIAMDREDKATVWPNVTDLEAVTAVLGSHAYLPDVESTPGRHLETKHALVQRGSDLGFVRRLARRNGYLFWITCDPTGVETAHFKPPPVDGGAEVGLSINLSDSNIGELKIDWDVERPTSAVSAQLDLNSKTGIDGSADASPVTPLGLQGLSMVAGGTRSLHLTTPADDVGDLKGRTEGALVEADFFVRANCQTTAHLLGSVVRSHTLVNLQGAGSRHSGNYLCSAVRHTIDAVSHRMEIELLRNGWTK